MPIPKEYSDLVTSLAAMTGDGRVNWRPDGAGVEVSVDNTRFSIWAGTDERTDEGFVALALKDSAGKTIDSWFVDEGDEHYSFMNTFYSSAKRQASGVPGLLAKLTATVRTATTVGDPKKT